LTSTAVALILAPQIARAVIVKGGLPWTPNAADPPPAVRPGPWLYFTADEAAAVEALVDRLIPADDLTPGGKDLGCAVYIDRQLAPARRAATKAAPTRHPIRRARNEWPPRRAPRRRALSLVA
jgi:hypothetical protein